MTTDLNTPSWWGGENRASGRPSLLGLIDNGTMDTQTAALLWLLVDRGSSILAAAGPQLAGKTTLLTTLLDLMPSSLDSSREQVLTRGKEEDFSFLKRTVPQETYILVAELSNHTPAYLWGDSVQTLFHALDVGYAMLATMHADAPEEVLDILRDYPVFIPNSQLHHVGVVVNLVLMYGEHELNRRVSGITLIEPGPSLVTLMDWNADDNSIAFLTSREVMGALARHVGLSFEELSGELKRRHDALQERLTVGDLTPAAVVQMAEAYN
jgi:hypothetical protein